jgi:hypothetical protein
MKRSPIKRRPKDSSGLLKGKKPRPMAGRTKKPKLLKGKSPVRMKGSTKKPKILKGRVPK